MNGKPEYDAQKTLLAYDEIKKILPHRYPFLLVDKVVHLDIEKGCIVCIKNVSGNEEFFNGHFPNMAVMPGVLLLESLAQAGGILINQKGYGRHIALLTTVKNAKFRAPVVPGDCLHLVVQSTYLSDRGGKVHARAYVGSKILVEADIGFGFSKKTEEERL